MKPLDEELDVLLDRGTTAMRNNVAGTKEIDEAGSRIFRGLKEERTKNTITEWMPAADLNVIET